MSSSNSTSSSSSILVLKENTAANPDPAPVASLLKDKKHQLGPSSGLSPGLCRSYQSNNVGFLFSCWLHEATSYNAKYIFSEVLIVDYQEAKY